MESETKVRRYGRYAELEDRGIVKSRATLARWQRELGFPRPIKLGARLAVFDLEAVEAWIAARAAVQQKPKAA